MKKVILGFAMLIYFGCAEAQIQKGKVMIGGDLNISGIKSTNSRGIHKTIDLNVKPQIGWFINDKTEIGLGLSYEYRFDNHPYWNVPGYVLFIGEAHSNLYYANPYITRYLKISNKFYLTASANLSFGAGVLKYTSSVGSPAKHDLLDIGLRISPGMMYFINQKLAITANIGSIYYSYNQDTHQSKNESLTTASNNYGLSISPKTISVGVRYVFGKNKD